MVGGDFFLVRPLRSLKREAHGTLTPRAELLQEVHGELHGFCNYFCFAPARRHDPGISFISGQAVGLLMRMRRRKTSAERGNWP
jgi:hypothetical protein